uniref:Uncharacterized protein n=1 Tax=Steinernema glaseri TaxID=37863 RepID=A0A1I7ZHI8_9BILA
MDTINQEQQLNESFRSEIRKSVLTPNAARAIPIPPKPSVPAWQRSSGPSQSEGFRTPPCEENGEEPNHKEESDEEVATAMNKTSEV